VISVPTLLCTVLYNLDAFSVLVCQVQVKQLMPPGVCVAVISNDSGQSVSVRVRYL